MPTVLQLSDVSIVRGGTAVVDSVNWTVESDERWVVLGPNGAGKSSLLQVAAAQSHPSSGTAEVLGGDLGTVDLFDLRPRIGFASTTIARRIPAKEKVVDVVLTAAYSVTGRWNEEYENVDVRRAHRVLDEWNLDHLAERTFGELSDGEQKRVQIARAVMTDPELLLLDEPAASLDLGAREELLQMLSGYAQSNDAPAIVMVTHHVEEIPRGDVLTAETLGSTFGVSLEVEVRDGRYSARASG
jgi:iron complex transport system ATP-binding protein